MKKKIAIISGVLALIIALGIGIFKTDASQASPRLNHEEIKDLVSAQYPGIITELELEKENNRAFYEIEIENDEVEYELLVDGDTGEILKLKEKRKLIDKKVAAKEKDADKKETKVKENDDDDRPTNTPSTKVESKEAKEQNNNGNQVQVKGTPKKVVVKDNDDDDKPKQQPNKSSSSEKQSNKQSQPKQTKKKNAVIDKNRAIQIALAEFPGKVEDVELDDDDGRLIYEIEIENGDQEAEIEIDAITGKIIMIDIDD